MPALEIHTPKMRLVLMALGSAAFVVAGIFLLSVPEGEAGAKAKLAAFVGIPFFGLCGMFCLVRLGSPKPALIIDEAGLTDYASMVNAGFIPWRDIKEVQITGFGNHRFLAVHVIDSEKYLARCHPIKRAVMRVNQSMVGTAITIPLSALSIGADEVIASINSRLAAG